MHQMGRDRNSCLRTRRVPCAPQQEKRRETPHGTEVRECPSKIPRQGALHQNIQCLCLCVNPRQQRGLCAGRPLLFGVPSRDRENRGYRAQPFRSANHQMKLAKKSELPFPCSGNSAEIFERFLVEFMFDSYSGGAKVFCLLQSVGETLRRSTRALCSCASSLACHRPLLTTGRPCALLVLLRARRG